MKYIVTNPLGMKVFSPAQPWQKEDEERKKVRRPPESVATRTIKHGETFEAVPHASGEGFVTVKLADFKGQQQFAYLVRDGVEYARLVATVNAPTLEERLAAIEARLDKLEAE